MSQTDKEWTPEYIFKFILIGNSSTGKTSMLQYFINQTSKTKVQQTVGVEFSSKLLEYKDKKIKLQIWDTAGQERFRSIARTYFKNTIGAIIVYDITNQDSFDAIDDWIKDARENGKSDLDVMVVGNKIDLKDQRVISKDHAEREMKTKMPSTLKPVLLLEKISINLLKITQGRIEKDEYNPQLKIHYHRTLKPKPMRLKVKVKHAIVESSIMISVHIRRYIYITQFNCQTGVVDYYFFSNSPTFRKHSDICQSLVYIQDTMY